MLFVVFLYGTLHTPPVGGGHGVGVAALGGDTVENVAKEQEQEDSAHGDSAVCVLQFVGVDVEVGLRTVAGRGALYGTIVAQRRQLAVKAFLDQVGQALAEGVEGDLLKHFVAEGVEEQRLCRALADAA